MNRAPHVTGKDFYDEGAWCGYHRCPCFFYYADSLRAQIGWRVAAATTRGERLLSRTSEKGRYDFFTAPATSVFTQEMITHFLMSLREWASNKLGTDYASTPQVQVFGNKSWRGLSQEAGETPWMYAYNLGSYLHTPRCEFKLCVPKRGRIATALKMQQLTTCVLAANELLVHKGAFPYETPSVTRIVAPNEVGHILLTGKLW